MVSPAFPGSDLNSGLPFPAFCNFGWPAAAHFSIPHHPAPQFPELGFRSNDDDALIALTVRTVQQWAVRDGQQVANLSHEKKAEMIESLLRRLTSMGMLSQEELQFLLNPDAQSAATPVLLSPDGSPNLCGTLLPWLRPGAHIESAASISISSSAQMTLGGAFVGACLGGALGAGVGAAVGAAIGATLPQ
jgi:hypothetical protein